MRKIFLILSLVAGTYLGLCAQVIPAKPGTETKKKSIFDFMTDISRQTTVEGTKEAFRQFTVGFEEKNNASAAVFFDMAKKEAAAKLLKFKDPSALEYVAQIKDPNTRHSLYEMLPVDWFTKRNVARAKKVLQKKIADSKPDMATNKAQERSFHAYTAAYAQLLFAAGNYKQALKFTKPRAGKVFLKEYDPVTYAQILLKNDDAANALPVLEDIVRKGTAGKTVKDALQESWLILGRDPLAFDAYLESLYLDIRKKKEEYLKDKSISYVAPLFTLSNLKGEKISLESLKGKVVFLDFWATWCGPCVRSFPAMQKAVDKYKAHPDVVFLFINSLEKESNMEKRKQDVAAFIAEKGFNFEVLLDEQHSGKYEVINQYKVSGIPAKFVIDKAGNVRYALSGFEGATDAAAEEVAALIENALKMK